MKKTIISLCLLSQSLCLLAAPENAPPPPAPYALDRPALISERASQSAMLAVAQAGERLIIAGERGIILYSDNRGKDWTQATTPTSVTLTALRFIDAQRGWAVGHMGIVLHTKDGGKNWETQLDGIRAAQLALTSAQQSGDENALRQATFLVTDGPDKPFFDLYIDHAGQGFIVGAYNLIFRTRDGGKTWQDWSAHVDNPRGLHLYGIARSDDALYIVGEQGLILRSSNTADPRFSAIASPYQGSWFGVLASHRGLITYGLRGNVFLLSPQTESWQPLPTGTTATISSATQLADGRLLLADQAGQLLRESSDGTFSPLGQRSSTPLTAITIDSEQQLIASSLRGVFRTSIATDKK